MEASEAGSEEKAMGLIRLYSDKFREIVFTIHPTGLEGEIRGKSSNVAWASRQMALLSGPKAHKYEVLTVMDADTCFAADYFLAVAYNYCVASPADRKLLMFAPSTVFDRNSKDVNVLVRLTDIMWSVGVMSNLYHNSPVKFPCSAYSVSMELACSVGFWDASAEAIGEDMHMYLKCFFSTEGKVIVKTIYSPASQCNIEGNGTFISGIGARYVQAKRHLWGCLDTAYSLRRTLFSILTPRLESAVSDSKDKKAAAGVGAMMGNDQQFALGQLLILFGRLYEAHIAMGHFFILIALSGLLIPTGENPSSFSVAYWKAVSGDGALTGSTGVHPILAMTLDMCGWLRFFCVVPIIFTIRNYEKYHQWVGFDRWRFSEYYTQKALDEGTVEKTAALSTTCSTSDLKTPPTSDIAEASNVLRVNRLGLRAQLASPRDRTNLIDWLCLPFSGLLFQAVPQCIVQLSQLWTDRLDYAVAAKPVLHHRHVLPTTGSDVSGVGAPLHAVEIHEMQERNSNVGVNDDDAPLLSGASSESVNTFVAEDFSEYSNNNNNNNNLVPSIRGFPTSYQQPLAAPCSDSHSPVLSTSSESETVLNDAMSVGGISLNGAHVGNNNNNNNRGDSGFFDVDEATIMSYGKELMGQQQQQLQQQQQQQYGGNGTVVGW
jgi:hypothetical protein